MKMWIHWKIATKTRCNKIVCKWNGMEWNDDGGDDGGDGSSAFIALVEYEIVSFVYLFVWNRFANVLCVCVCVWVCCKLQCAVNNEASCNLQFFVVVTLGICLGFGQCIQSYIVCTKNAPSLMARGARDPTSQWEYQYYAYSACTPREKMHSFTLPVAIEK